MNRKEQQFLRQRQTTRQLMGVTRLTEHGAVCGRDELLFYLLRPDNLSILSPEGIRGRVRALTGLLQGMASLELLALDSRESFLKNKHYDEYKEWLELEKKNLQEMADEHTMVETSEGRFEWTQEMTDQCIAEYEQTLNDIKNGLLVSKSVDGDTECMTTFSPNWVSTTAD